MTIAQLALPLPAEGEAPVSRRLDGAGVTAADRAACVAIRSLACMARHVPPEEREEVWAITGRIGAIAQRMADGSDQSASGKPEG